MMLTDKSKRSNEEALAEFELFSNLSAETVRDLSRRCRWHRFGMHQPIVEYQDSTRDVYFIIEGRVRAIYFSVSGREVSFSELPAGEMFGEIAAIDGQPRSVSVVALTDTLVAAMPVSVFWEMLRHHEAAVTAILNRLTRLVRRLSERVVEFSTLAVRDRIRAELLRLARQAAHGQNMVILMPPPTHAELASRVSTHREAVTREMCELCRLGIVERQNRALVVRNVAALADMVVSVLGEVS